jgi:hypothetical protein
MMLHTYVRLPIRFCERIGLNGFIRFISRSGENRLCPDLREAYNTAGHRAPGHFCAATNLV